MSTLGKEDCVCSFIFSLKSPRLNNLKNFYDGFAISSMYQKIIIGKSTSSFISRNLIKEFLLCMMYNFKT
jgi:hypothetical protein